jgi:hypothetical protein
VIWRKEQRQVLVKKENVCAYIEQYPGASQQNISKYRMALFLFD